MEKSAQKYKEREERVVFIRGFSYLCFNRYWSMAKKKEITIRSGAAEYLSYVASIGDQPLSVELRYEDENIWLTQKLMAELYGVTVSDINQHLKTIYDDGELTRVSTVKKFLIVQQEGSRTVNRHPDVFAAAVPICGDINPERLANRFEGVSFSLYHGDSDPNVPVSGSRDAYRALKAAGADVRYHEFPGCGHVCWWKAFEMPDFMEWMFSKSKKKQ